ncbi:MAG: type II toxin-antitoxin system Phd/YefM family antitoxin [Nocardioides sp.]
MRSIPLSEAKDRLSALVDAADSTHEIVQITKHGRPAAVLMSADDLESLRETIYWLSQPGVHDDVARGRRDRADEAFVSGEDLRAGLGLPPL